MPQMTILPLGKTIEVAEGSARRHHRGNPGLRFGVPIHKPLTKEKTMSEIPIVIHVRFAPDGTVTEIGERPASLSAQAWFNKLSLAAASFYQSLSGGRGVFRLPRADLDNVKAAALN
jgi:hypothetical protein